MAKLELNIDPRVKIKFNNYPSKARKKMKELRNLILETAKEVETITILEETLKWGEPSYLAKHGSTIRMDWKEKTPDQYAMYFKCTSKLVPTFKAVFGATFKYENNRAILFDFENEIPKASIKECIRLALTYHKVKHLPRLGM